MAASNVAASGAALSGAAPRTRALLFGGTGAVGTAVLKGLSAAQVRTTFTYHRQAERAQALAAEHQQQARSVDLAQPQAVRELLAELPPPDVFIHAAAVSAGTAFAELSDAQWDAAYAVNCRAAALACQALCPRMVQRGGGHVVLLGALDRSQSLPLPVHFAATQGMLSALAMALAKEYGRGGVRVNYVALGSLNEGLSREMRPELLTDYKNFSALRRLGAPEEAARAVLWLALENTYMNGRVLAVNGGI